MENVEGEATDHVVDIHPRVNESLLAKMVDRISKSPPSTLPRERRTTDDKQCIFPVRKSLNYDIPNKWFEPQVVALGPYHHSKYNEKFKMMEEIKWRWFASFMESRKGKLEECLIQLGPLVKEFKEFYSGSQFGFLYLASDEFLEMMVVDGFFILALFFRATLNLTELDRDERSIFDNPLYRLDMVRLPKIYGDLLLLENQILSSVLEKLYTICFSISSRKSLLIIAMNFLCSISAIPESRKMTTDGLHWLHLLDLVRSILISRAHNKKIWRTCEYRQFSPIPCVTKLCRAGIKVKRHMADTFLDVKFKNVVIRMPDIILDDSMCSLLVNCLAFEQSCNISKHFSIYITLLDCLINTAKDVDYLCDCGAIGNFLGTDDEVAKFINKMGKGLTIYNNHDDDDDFFLLDVFGDVNKYYRKGLNWGKWTSFKSEYFGKPWLLISAFVGLVLLVLTFLQTCYTIYAYEHPKN